MYRDVIVNVTVKIKMKVNEGVEVDDVIGELDYNFVDQTQDADIEDTEITDYEVIDSN